MTEHAEKLKQVLENTISREKLRILDATKHRDWARVQFHRDALRTAERTLRGLQVHGAGENQ